MYDNARHVTDTFTVSNLSEELLQAQESELDALKKILHDHYERKKSPIQILDIGIGNARILKSLFSVKEIWDNVALYDGIDVSQNCIDLSKKTIEELGIKAKAEVKLMDAQNLDIINKRYDLIISTWFTAGNFYPDTFDANNYKSESQRLDMSDNPKFTSIFRKACNLLFPGGEVVIGSAYIDNEETRKKQEKAYRKFGWTIITDEKDCFTATRLRIH